MAILRDAGLLTADLSLAKDLFLTTPGIKKQEIFLKNNKKWIIGNRNNLSCADVQKEKMAALQPGFIKTKLL